MPSSVIGSIAGSVGSSLIGGALGGGSPDAPNVQVYQPQHTGEADNQWWALQQQNQANNPYSAYQQQYQDIYNKTYNNPYATGAQTAANNAGQQFTNMGNTSLNNANQLSSAAMSTLPYAQQVLQTAMDPQNALYDRTLQQTQDQQRVGQAARGITMSPYGAGLENQALQNFNIDWQNNQLNRQTTGLDSANKAITGATANASSANNLAGAGAAALQQGGLLPYTTANNLANDQGAALSNMVNSQLGQNNVNSTAMQQLLQYMGLGASQSNAQGNFDLQNYQNQLAQAGSTAGGLGGLISSGANWLGASNSSLPWMTNGGNLLNQLSLLAG